MIRLGPNFPFARIALVLSRPPPPRHRLRCVGRGAHGCRDPEILEGEVRDCHGRGLQPHQAGREEGRAALLQLWRHALQL